jgi:hypothetical protein
MGDIIKPDRAIFFPVLHDIIHQIESDWLPSEPRGRLYLCREASFYLITFCGALQGEEVPMANLTGMLKHWEAGGS